MSRLRISISTMMAVVLLVALGFAALRSSSEWVAGGLQVSVVLLLATAVLMATTRRDRSRMTWVGVAIFGWSYLLEQPIRARYGSPPIHVVMAEVIRPFIWPDTALATFDHSSFVAICNSLMVIIFGIIGAEAGRNLAARDDRPRS